MSKLIFLLFLIGVHIFTDFTLQGWLASAKQKNYWKKELNLSEQQFQNSIYRNDYKCALLIHSIQWSLAIMFGVLLYSYIMYNKCDIIIFFYTFLWNVGCHYLVDDKKANEFSLNLIEDQGIHFVQIFFTWLMFL